MNEHYLVFTLGERRCALPLSRVERVVRAVEITMLPGGAPAPVRGVINVQGVVIPVLDVRTGPDRVPTARIGGDAAQPNADDEMILLTLRGDRRAALLCDEVEGVRTVATQDIAHTGDLLPESLPGRGDVLKVSDGLIYVNDLDSLLDDRVAWPVWDTLTETPTDGVDSSGG